MVYFGIIFCLFHSHNGKCDSHLQVIQLRKACSHPYLFPGIEPEPYEEGEHLVQVTTTLILYLITLDLSLVFKSYWLLSNYYYFWSFL